MSVSLTFATAFLEALTGYTTNYAERISPCYLGLSTTVPDDDGSNFTEPSTSYGYERMLLTNSSGSGIFGSATVSSQVATVTNESSKHSVVATGSWGTIVAFGLFNASTGGTPLAFGEVDDSFSVDSNELASLGAGDITITLSTTDSILSDTALTNLIAFYTGASTSSPLGSACYLGLSLASPGSTGSNFSEPSTSYGYSRICLGTSSGSHIMSQAEYFGSGLYYCYNTEDVTFDTPTASWGTVTHWGLFTAATGGTLMYWGALDESAVIKKSYIPIFKYGAFKIWLT